jgi:hypothetical protein
MSGDAPGEAGEAFRAPRLPCPFDPVVPGDADPAAWAGAIDRLPASADDVLPFRIAVTAVADRTLQKTSPATMPRCCSIQPTHPRRGMTG